jgi:hypothetical protein
VRPQLTRQQGQLCQVIICKDCQIYIILGFSTNFLLYDIELNHARTIMKIAIYVATLLKKPGFQQIHNIVLNKTPVNS